MRARWDVPQGRPGHGQVLDGVTAFITTEAVEKQMACKLTIHQCAAPQLAVCCPPHELRQRTTVLKLHWEPPSPQTPAGDHQALWQ